MFLMAPDIRSYLVTIVWHLAAHLEFFGRLLKNTNACSHPHKLWLMKDMRYILTIRDLKTFPSEFNAQQVETHALTILFFQFFQPGWSSHTNFFFIMSDYTIYRQYVLFRQKSCNSSFYSISSHSSWAAPSSEAIIKLYTTNKSNGDIWATPAGFSV
jgi:hypothetical protein